MKDILKRRKVEQRSVFLSIEHAQVNPGSCLPLHVATFTEQKSGFVYILRTTWLRSTISWPPSFSFTFPSLTFITALRIQFSNDLGNRIGP